MIPAALFNIPSSSSWLIVEATELRGGLNLPIDPVQWICALSRTSIRNVLTFSTLAPSPHFLLQWDKAVYLDFNYNNIF